jgi:twitching motility protein PilT
MNASAYDLPEGELPPLPSFDDPALYDTGFDRAAYPPPPALDTQVDDPIPVFDSGTFDVPVFGASVFEAAPQAAPPAWGEPAAAAAPAMPAASDQPLSRREQRERAQALAEAQAQAPVAPALQQQTVVVPELPHFGEPTTPASSVTPVGIGAETTIRSVLTPAPIFDLDVDDEAASDTFLLSSNDDDALESISNLGQGQEGSDPDLVAALNIVVSFGASDLHLSVNTEPMVRVDGGLQTVPGFEKWGADKVTFALHSIMSAEQRAHFATELELDFAYTLSKDSRFRVNIYQQRDSLGAAFRLIPTEIKQLDVLGIPKSIGNFAKLARGLVLVTGPTGSGKSTTLAALIDLVNSTRADHIVTVEDPIEFMHTNKKSLVNQREVGHDTHSFANALKHVLRQDPDVILIGELRDLETISVALTAAETGHLVFATLHTQDAAQTIDRVIDVFPPHQQGQVRAQLAATLQGVVCQTLVKKLKGSGRAVATEVLVTTPAISNLIREGKTYQIHSAMQAGREVGMHTMDQHLADLVDAGQISHSAAYEKAHDVEDLKQLIQRVSDAGGNATGDTDFVGIDFGDAHSTRNG